MAIDVVSNAAICCRCGTAFSNKKGKFHPNYGELYKGSGFVHICKHCVEELYDIYLSQCNNQKLAVRQVCRKLDLYWDESVFEQMMKKIGQNHVMSQYMSKISTYKYVGKCYDDTLKNEGTLWNFVDNENYVDTQSNTANTFGDDSEGEPANYDHITEDVILFWGSGYTMAMYDELEQRRKYWMSRLPQELELDIGTEAIIRQICSLELDINRDRAAGKSVEKSVTALNTLLGSANLKPVQKKQEEIDSNYLTTPLGVWLYKYETKRPLPEIDESLKDVNGIKKYIFTWMGHLCKMLNIKNTYSDLYEEEINKYKVERPEYDGDDDETVMNSVVFNPQDGHDGDDNE